MEEKPENFSTPRFGLRRKARPLAVSPGDFGGSNGLVGMPGLAEGLVSEAGRQAGRQAGRPALVDGGALRSRRDARGPRSRRQAVAGRARSAVVVEAAVKRGDPRSRRQAGERSAAVALVGRRGAQKPP